MATISKQLLSGSTQGKGVKVTQTATAGDTIHTAVSGTTDIDECFVFCTNTDTSAILLTLEWGGVTAPDNHIQATIAAGQTQLVATGLPLQNGLIIKAFAGTANKLIIYGYVNRMDI